MSRFVHGLNFLNFITLSVAQLPLNLCPQTQFKNSDGMCTSCPLNKFVVDYNGNTPVNACRCERGWETINNECVQCPAGKAGPEANRCTACISGRFTIAPGQIFCQECPPGLHCSVATGPTMYKSLAQPTTCQTNSTRPLQLFESFSLHKKYAVTKESIN